MNKEQQRKERERKHIEAVLNGPHFYCADYSNAKVSIFDHCVLQCSGCIDLVKKHREQTKNLGL